MSRGECSKIWLAIGALTITSAINTMKLNNVVGVACLANLDIKKLKPGWSYTQS